MMNDSTGRFSDRVENYVRYRPSYPVDVIRLMVSECGLSENSVVADIGSGTGIFARLLLESGCRVFGVEPNDEMRRAAEALFEENARFTSISGTAEATGLPPNSVDIVTAAQAFHWFDRPKTKQEFRRILKDNGWVVLVWNERKVESPFERAYEGLLQKYSKDYASVDHRNINGEMLAEFFSPGKYTAARFDNVQSFDLDGLKGRALSSSYVPAEGAPNHKQFMDELEAVFQKFSPSGKVCFNYDTNVYYGRLR